MYVYVATKQVGRVHKCVHMSVYFLFYACHIYHIAHTHTGDCGQRQARGSWKKSGRQERREARGNDACSTHLKKKSL